MRPTWKCQISSVALVACMVLAVTPSAFSQPQIEPETVLPPTFEGSWVRTDTNGSGSFGGLTAKFKQAELTDKGKEYLSRMPRRNAGGNADPGYARSAAGIIITNPTPCIFNGGQLRIEYDSEGFIAVKTKSEVVFVQDRGQDRHVYLDKAEIPDPSLRYPTDSGYSIAKIEPNGVLAVTVSDFTPGAVTAGGYRTPKTVLEERYIPDADGKHLKQVLTWKDPEIYVTPHTYEYTFERVPKGSVSLDESCNATNPLEGQGAAPPKQ